MDAPEDPTPAEIIESALLETAPSPAPSDAISRLFASTALGLTALALIEVAGTIAVGLAVTTGRLNFLHRQGYAFLTQLEKSPVSLLLVLAAVLSAVAVYRFQTDARTTRLATLALWMTVAAAALIGVGSILAVLARFRVAELVATQPIDSITRRVLFSFVVRNFGAAVLTLLIAFGVLFGPRAKPDVIG